MNMKSQNFRKSSKLFGALCGGLLISLPVIPQALAQESTVKVNPRPSIFSEPPYNRSQAPGSPESGTQQPSPSAVSNDQQPLVEPRQAPSATIALSNGMVNIKLVNNTAAKITFQVIGDTAPRSLEGKSDVTLQALKAPVTVTFERQDGGQLIVTPQGSSEAGSLEVTFKEATNAAQGRSAMRIERNGSVFLN